MAVSGLEGAAANLCEMHVDDLFLHDAYRKGVARRKVSGAPERHVLGARTQTVPHIFEVELVA